MCTVHVFSTDPLQYPGLYAPLGPDGKPLPIGPDGKPIQQVQRVVLGPEGTLLP